MAENSGIMTTSPSPPPKFEGFKKFPLYDYAKLWNELGPMSGQNMRTVFKEWLYNEIFSTMDPD